MGVRMLHTVLLAEEPLAQRELLLWRERAGPAGERFDGKRRLSPEPCHHRQFGGITFAACRQLSLTPAQQAQLHSD